MAPAAPSAPSVSVVICTRNRPDTIEQAVASVLANEYSAFDVTVIDQSTTAATENILRPLLERDPRLRYTRAEAPGLSRAYNMGIDGTRGEILAFTDDDCVVPRDWLSAIVRALGEDADADLLYGQVLPASDTPGSGTPTLFIPAPERLSRRDGFKVFGMGANFAARRRLFSAVGGFDEVLGGGGPLCSSQDYDLAYRTFRAGRAILLRPEVKVIHHAARDPQDYRKMLRAYGIGDGAFYFKHVRCRDLFALRLLITQVAVTAARVLVHRLRGHHRLEMTYVRSILIGIRECLRFDVDRRSRLYIPQ